MKKIVSIFICLSMLYLLAACSPALTQESTATPSVSPSIAQSVLPSPSVSSLEVSESPAVQKTQPEETQSSPAPSDTDELYSSYAHMVSFDPDSGLAEFDYFDILKGEDAIKWLVEQEGYSLADAQEEVANYADSEFIEKNTNSKLRTIDLNGVKLKLMYEPDGTMVDGAQHADAGIEDINTLYALDTDLVLNSFFYYVTVQNGKAVSVDQVYWP